MCSNKHHALMYPPPLNMCCCFGHPGGDSDDSTVEYNKNFQRAPPATNPNITGGRRLSDARGAPGPQHQL